MKKIVSYILLALAIILRICVFPVTLLSLLAQLIELGTAKLYIMALRYTENEDLDEAADVICIINSKGYETVGDFYADM